MKLLGIYQDHKELVQKYVFKDDIGTIEISHIHTKHDTDIYCVPSFYGCSLGCTFCHITTENIATMMTKVKTETILLALSKIPKNKPKTLISIMGMGDPVLNPILVNELADEVDRVAIATIFPGKTIKAIQPDVKIHYSLHSPLEEKRDLIIPAIKMPIKEVMEYLSYRRDKEIHYTLIDDVNDSDIELSELYNLLDQYKINIKFLAFNETGNLKKSYKIDQWIRELSDIDGVGVEFYTPPGRNIGSSCGEFSKFFYQDNKDSEEFKEFERKYRIF
jgi:adenine C2-methylase RlmN of 23S rRNA A2503 and tRNA A37